MPYYKRKGIWYARVQIGGVRTEQSLGAGASVEDAKELEAALRKRLRDDRQARRVGRGLNRSFGEAMLFYMKSPEAQQLKSYQSLRSIANLIRPYLESVPLEQAPEAAEEMKQALLGEGLENGTINRRLAFVRRILRLSYRPWKWLSAPLTVTLLPEDNERQIYPEIDLAYQIVSHCRPANGDALLVIYFTGIRRGEFIRLNRNPNDFIQGDFLRLYSGNKTKKARRVPITAPIKDIISRMPLPVTVNTIRHDWETAREAVGRPELHLHDFRHGFASNVLEVGGELIDVMNLLGHTSAQTAKRYSHLKDDRQRRLAGKVAKLAAGKRRRTKVPESDGGTGNAANA